MTQKSLQTIAAEWHSGQNSALYAYASTGTVHPELSIEIRRCIPAAKPKELAELLRLYVATARALDLQDVKANSEFWHRYERNSDGTPIRCRKTGALKTWKTRPNDFKQPVKYGLKISFYLTPANIADWCATL